MNTQPKSSASSPIPIGCQRVITFMKSGYTLHSGFFGMWLMDPEKVHSHNVNRHTVNALIRRKLVERSKTIQGTGEGALWILSTN